MATVANDYEDQQKRSQELLLTAMLRLNGKHCPHCSSKDVRVTYVTADTEVVYNAECECYACGECFDMDEFGGTSGAVQVAPLAPWRGLVRKETK
jgi:hypothetical protein